MKKLTLLFLALVVLGQGLHLTAQTIRREYWLNVPGGNVGALTSAPGYPSNPTGVEFPNIFEGPVGFADDYGTRFRGYVHPPVSGNYVFWISGDDNCELYLSSDAQPSSKVLIATVNTWTGSREWDKELNQQSATIPLVAGQAYYIEALHKEGGGGDNVAVGWMLPDTTLERPIPGNRLTPFVLSTNPPSITQQPVNLSVSEGTQAVFYVGANGGEPMSFQWYRDGELMIGQTFPNLILNAVLLDDDGARFRCQIQNPYGNISSAEVTLTVTPEKIPPVIASMTPPPGSSVRVLGQVEVFFSEPVIGVDAGDLRINGLGATSVSGVGAGPYLFSFPTPAAGTVQFAWAPGHGIFDLSDSPNAFAGGAWQVALNPSLPVPDVVINEFLASNLSGLVDQDGQLGDWIELHNRGAAPVNLAGWTLTDDPDVPGAWPFPDVTIAANGYLVVFASGKDRRTPGSQLHTNFKLSRAGDFLALHNNELPRTMVDALTPGYPEQRGDHSFGRDTSGQWRYFEFPSPGLANGDSTIEGLTAPPHFSAKRGFYDRAFNLHLSADPGATIRYTTDGSEPTTVSGTVYSGPIQITATTMIRAAAFRSGYLPSNTTTHTYLVNEVGSIASLPVLSIVTDTNNLWGPTGIMEIDPRNTVNRGIAWERPVSAELIRSGDNGGFALDAGLRVQGGGYVRDRYDPNASLPFSKYSFRLYFRGDYGSTRLKYPMFPDVPFDEFETISLRAGMNDHSNPFIVDELMRRLFGDTGQVSSHGTLVNLFLNGQYKGYYNPTERIDADFLHSWYGGTNEWDLIAQFGEVREGDAVKWNEMRNFIIGNDMTSPTAYANAGQLLDIDNFIDYLLVNMYGGTGDWPHNNWRAARERTPGAKWQFIMWDAEWALGNAGRTATINNITGELAGTSDIARLFQSLLKSPEFRIRFADHVHRHMFNGGVLTDAHILERYWELRNQMAVVLPGMSTQIHTTFVPNRRAIVLNQMAAVGIYASDNAPVFNQHGGRVPDGFNLSMSSAGGTIYYSLNGPDPRLPAAANGTSYPYLNGDAAKKVLVPSLANGGSTLGDGWKGGAEPFNDASWTAGTGGVGYDTAVTYDELIQIDVEPQMLGVNGSAFVRIPFTVDGASLAELNQLTLRVRYDDGFIAYLNGVEVMRANAPASPAWDSVAVAGNDDNAAMNFQGFDISQHLGLLRAGANLLAVHALNVATNSSDFLFNAEIEGRKNVPGAVNPAAVTYGGPIPINQPVTVRARSFDGTAWSAMTEATFLPNELGIPVRFTEINYNPPGGDAYEFVELHNYGFAPLNVSGFSLEGVNFLFPANSVMPGGATWVIASDVNPGLFAGRYPGVPVAGHFGGSLSNGGERLALLDVAGRVITAVTYGDGGGWSKLADGAGRSLELADPLDDPDQPGAWRASGQPGGNPGTSPASASVPVIRLNEIMADNTNAVPHEGTYPDWIELHNAGGGVADISGWSLTDDGNERKYVFPPGTTIPAAGYLVVWCDALTTSGLHTGFSLGRNGETISLFDAATNRVDATSYGLQLTDFSLGRVGGTADPWQLSQPTPGAPNLAAATAPAASLRINEWMANPVAGADDWFELFNGDPSLPVALQGIHLGNGASLHPFRGRSFLKAGGFVKIVADEKAGIDHVQFKLPAAGGVIAVYDANGAAVDSVSYGVQSEGVSSGRLPDGGTTFQSFAGSASPGASNYVLNWTGPYINEFMAINEGSVTMANGRVADWLELFNPLGVPFDLSGMSLSIGKAKPGEWKFPAGTSIAAGGHLVIWCDGDLPVSTNLVAELNTGKSLTGKGDAIHLFNTQNQPVQSVEFGFQIPNKTLGRSGSFWSLKDSPTPGTANSANAALGSVDGLRFNEWSANPVSGDDWIEIYNTNALPVSLIVYLSDDPSIAGKTKSKLPANSYIAGGGWVQFVADNDPGKGMDHLPFNLAAGGEHLLMYWANLAPLDSVDFGPQLPASSTGRFPDGAGTFTSFTATMSPGESNYLPLNNAVVNEVLAHTDPPLVDAVELFNPTGLPVDVGGWYLSDDVDNLKKFRVPTGTSIPAGGYLVFDESHFNGGAGTMIPFTFNSARGDGAFLSQADGLGNLTGYRSQVTFGPSLNGVSFGRHTTSVGVDFVPQAQRTLGAVNGVPAVGPVVVMEIMADPANVPELNPDDAEFLELANITGSPVDLHPAAGPWKITGGVGFEFAAGASIPADGRVLIVGFDPVTKPLKLAAFRQFYGVPESVAIHGPFSGRLAGAGDVVTVKQPDAPQTSGPDIGLVPYVAMERIAYSGASPWPTNGIGQGASLQRRVAGNYGNDPINWQAGLPTPGLWNVGVADGDLDGMPDHWELANGYNPNSAADAALDDDGDGMSTLKEYRSGTNPRDSQSYLKVESVARSGAQTQLQFKAAAGIAYTLEYRDAFGTGGWLPLANIPSAYVPRMMTITDSVGIGRRFYRLAAPSSP